MNTEHVSASAQKKMARVFKALEKEPRKFNMDNWLITSKDTDPEVIQQKAQNLSWESSLNLRAIQENNPPCGTIACLAGQTLITIGKVNPKEKLRNKFVYWFPENTWIKAQKLLGITRKQAERLFFPFRWPYLFQERLEAKTSGTKGYLAVAKKRWEYMIKTGM